MALWPVQMRRSGARPRRQGERITSLTTVARFPPSCRRPYRQCRPMRRIPRQSAIRRVGCRPAEVHRTRVAGGDPTLLYFPPCADPSLSLTLLSTSAFSSERPGIRSASKLLLWVRFNSAFSALFWHSRPPFALKRWFSGPIIASTTTRSLTP
jgi:hypothetical protein